MNADRFVDRRQELAALQRLWETDQPHFFILYGRRRVGKTELLRQFCQDKPHLYFQATQVGARDNLRHFLREAAEATGDTFLTQADFVDWEAPLVYLVRQATAQPLVVVLDEFPYLCRDTPALPSLLQRFWDQHGRTGRLFLVLCGSAVSFMEDEVLAQRSPLFGRRTGQLELLPLGFREAAEFLPRYNPTDQARAFGMLGGMPMYQAQFDDRLSVGENVERSIFQPQALLYDEPEYLLRSGLRDPGTYNSILEAIASGLTRHNEIAQRIGKPAPEISPYLETLLRLRLIRRDTSLADRAPRKRSVGRYHLADPFLRFWYRFVLPNRSLLEIGQGPRVWRERVAPQLDEYTGLTFEEICREYVRRYSDERLGTTPEGEVGRFWSRDVEIDVVCRNTDGTHTCGECKWSRRQVDESVLDGLMAKSTALPADWQEGLRYVLFSRSGFTAALSVRAARGNIVLVGLDDLYGKSGSGAQ